jgi:ketopantoate reductase
VVTTKNIPDIPPTVSEIIAPAVTPGHTVILLLQNGLNIERPLFEAFPTNVILSGVSLISATEHQPGRISHDDPDRLIVSPYLNPSRSSSDEEREEEIQRGTAAAQHFVDMYNAAQAVSAMLDLDVGFVRWRKLVYNACYNGVCAIVGLDTTSLRYAHHPLTDLIRPAMWEIWHTAHAAGHPLPEYVVETMIDVDYWAFFKPSMLQDVERVCLSPPDSPAGTAREFRGGMG